MDITKFRGTGVALVTPFHADLTVDFNGLKKLLEHTATGVDYYVVLGTTGESATTTATEQASILDFVKSNNDASLPIVIGIGGNDTNKVLQNIEKASLEGVDALLSVSPYYNKPSQEGIYQHFLRIAEASPVPIILYNVPARTMSNMEAATTLRLAEHENIIAVKEASGNLVQCMEIAKNKPDDFMLISGEDILTTSMMAIGAEGVISVMANAFPTDFKEVTHEALSGNFDASKKALLTMLEINPLMYEESNPVGLKEVLRLLGVCENHVRQPLLPASDSLSERIKELVKIKG